LGFIFDSIQQSITIPPEKRKKLLTMMQAMAQKSQCPIREFAGMIGSLIAVCPAVQYGILYTKRFEREKFLALRTSSMDYTKQMLIPTYLKVDFHWWIRIFSNTNQCNFIHSTPFTREIFSDASLTGWGASCGSQSTHGWWTPEDKSLHINTLELKAAFYALKCFAPELQDCNILLRIDNTTAIAYINKFGSIKYPILSDIARDIWKWCEERNIYLFASYIASIDNHIADAESRVTDTDTEWSLSDQAFKYVNEEFGPFDLDLFASIINAKNEIYVSWLPDPGAWTIDAFTLAWHDVYFYAFPPFILIPRILRKIVDEKAKGVLIVPWWPSQSWFPMFLHLLISDPIVLPPSHSLLFSPSRSQHPQWKTFPWWQGDYQESLPVPSSTSNGIRNHSSLTRSSYNQTILSSPAKLVGILSKQANLVIFARDQSSPRVPNTGTPTHWFLLNAQHHALSYFPDFQRRNRQSSFNQTVLQRS